MKRGASCRVRRSLVDDGARLAADHALAGPAVIEERTTTVVVPAAFTCRVDPWRNYILTLRF